jgi:hypothetical protein
MEVGLALLREGQLTESGDEHRHHVVVRQALSPF